MLSRVGSPIAAGVAALVGIGAALAYQSAAQTVSASPATVSPAPTPSPSGGASRPSAPARVPVGALDCWHIGSLDDIVGSPHSQVFSAEVIDVGPRRTVRPLADDLRFVLDYRPVRVRVTRVYTGTMSVGEETFLRDRSRLADENEWAGTLGSYDALWPTGQSLTVLGGDAVDVGDGIRAVAASWVFVNLANGSSIEITQDRQRGLGDTPVATPRLDQLLTRTQPR